MLLYEADVFTLCRPSDDCQSDADCHGHGLCSVSEGFYHRRRCFCDIGYFGKTCEKGTAMQINRHYLGKGIGFVY